MKKITKYFNENQGLLAVVGIVISIFLAVLFSGESKNNNIEDTLRIVQQSIEQRDLQNPILRKFIRVKYGKDYEEMDDYSIAIFWEDLEKYLEEVKESEEKYEKIKQEMTDEEQKTLLSEINKARDELDYQKVNQLLAEFGEECSEDTLPGQIAGVFIDRNGNPVQASFWLKDEQDKEYCKHNSHCSSHSDTALSNGSFETVEVPCGKYKLHVTVYNYFGIPRNFKKEVRVSGSDVDLGNVVLPWSWIIGTFVDRNGNFVQASFWLKDEQDKEYCKYNSHCSSHSDTALSNGSFKTVAVADGKYILNISIYSYFGIPRSLEKEVKVSGSDINLGNVVLPWSRIAGVFIDRNGNPVQASFWLKDEQDKEYCKYNSHCSSHSDTALSNGSFKTVAVADGKYTLYIRAHDYRSLEKKITISGKDVSLEEIILEKQN